MDIHNTEISLKYLKSLILFDFNNKSSSIEENQVKSLKNNNLYEFVNLIIKNENQAKINIFMYLGIFKNTNGNKFFKVYLRKFYLEESKFIVDIMTADITEIKKAEFISSETMIKQKLFSKFAHEFKTPLIVIKSLVTDLMESICNEDLYQIQSTGNNINYLSEYITFLINDIIYYTNNTSIPIQIEEVNLMDVIDFSRCVTEALINVMPGNKNNIKVESIFDYKLNSFLINSDKTRLKQVLLNFLSNSVKFTKQGLIRIKQKWMNLIIVFF